MFDENEMNSARGEYFRVVSRSIGVVGLNGRFLILLRLAGKWLRVGEIEKKKPKIDRVWEPVRVHVAYKLSRNV